MMPILPRFAEDDIREFYEDKKFDDLVRFEDFMISLATPRNGVTYSCGYIVGNGNLSQFQVSQDLKITWEATVCSNWGVHKFSITEGVAHDIHTNKKLLGASDINYFGEDIMTSYNEESAILAFLIADLIS